MPNPVTIIVDGETIEAEAGQTLIEAADAAGVYIPRLCHMPGLEPWGSCRLCTVRVNGRTGPACIQPVMDGMFVESDTEELRELRRTLIEMLFVEGNHFCMACEKSGNCELQALAYRFRITAPTLPYASPVRDLDGSHPDILIDHDRCILCARCVRASRDLDGKNVFGFVGRSGNRRIAVNAEEGLSATRAEVTDRALDACPVGALLRKGVGYRIPVGQRLYDREPIGSEIERGRS